MTRLATQTPEARSLSALRTAEREARARYHATDAPEDRHAWMLALRWRNEAEAQLDHGAPGAVGTGAGQRGAR